MQALHLELKLMATIDLTHHGSEFPKLTLAPRSWPSKISVQLFILTTCPPTCSVIQLYPLSSFSLNGSCKNYFSSHFISIHHSTSQEKPYVFPLLIPTLPLHLSKSFGLFKKGYKPRSFLHIPIPLLLLHLSCWGQSS